MDRLGDLLSTVERLIERLWRRFEKLEAAEPESAITRCTVRGIEYNLTGWIELLEEEEYAPMHKASLCPFFWIKNMIEAGLLDPKWCERTFGGHASSIRAVQPRLIWINYSLGIICKRGVEPGTVKLSEGVERYCIAVTQYTKLEEVLTLRVSRKYGVWVPRVGADLSVTLNNHTHRIAAEDMYDPQKKLKNLGSDLSKRMLKEAEEKLADKLPASVMTRVYAIIPSIEPVVSEIMPSITSAAEKIYTGNLPFVATLYP